MSMPRFEDLTSKSFYERLITDYVNSEVPKSPDRISVTEVAACLRLAYFRRVKPVSFLGPQAVRVFFGKVIHEAIEGLIRERLGSVGVEVRRELDCGDFKVVGRADLSPVHQARRDRSGIAPYLHHAGENLPGSPSP